MTKKLKARQTVEPRTGRNGPSARADSRGSADAGRCGPTRTVRTTRTINPARAARADRQTVHPRGPGDEARHRARAVHGPRGERRAPPALPVARSGDVPDRRRTHRRRFCELVRTFSALDERRRPAARHVRRRHGEAAADPRHGFRRAVLSAGPSGRTHQPQGAQQRVCRQPPTTSAARTRSAAKRAGTMRCTRPSARSTTSGRCSRAAHAHGLEIALDFAIQCSPDHPWLKQHPGWFAWRPDGTLRYAENIRRRSIRTSSTRTFMRMTRRPGLWLALRDVILFWIDAGVRIFPSPRRQSAYEAAAVLGMADRRRARTPIRTRSSWPKRSRGHA